MNQLISKYQIRAPRYVLQAEDNTLVRVAGPNQTPWEEGTDISNISLTGLAFKAPRDLCPLLGEFIKIQFEVPGSQQMACYALVVRIDKLNDFEFLVSVNFEKLSMPHRVILAQGLARKMRDIKKETDAIIQSQLKTKIMNNKLSFINWSMLLFCNLSLYYIFSNFDSYEKFFKLFFQ